MKNVTFWSRFDVRGSSRCGKEFYSTKWGVGTDTSSPTKGTHRFSPIPDTTAARHLRQTARRRESRGQAKRSGKNEEAKKIIRKRIVRQTVSFSNKLTITTSMTQVARIKGYLPVRILLPSEDGTQDETFVYVKEHSEKASNKSPPTTMFVVNAPVVPGVATRILLKALFGSWADIQRVTVVSHSTRAQTSMTPSFLQKNSEGSYAHVIYSSPQAFKKTMKALEKQPELKLDAAELQTLQDASVDEGEEEQTYHSTRKNGKQSIVLELAQRYRRSIRNREELLEECNQIMEEFEETTETLRLQRERAANEPDEDGFVTVTYNNNNSNAAVEVQQQSSGSKRSSSKSSRHRKKQKKKCEDLTDFYRFQNKQQKKDALQELRRQFQHDVEKVQKLRENFQPF